MRKIFRMILFSGVALYLTSLWNKGFETPTDWTMYLQATILIALAYYLILPVAKIILLPLNLLTFGLVSTLLYVAALYILSKHLGLLEINEWTFSDINISYIFNLFLSSFSISVIIKTLEQLI